MWDQAVYSKRIRDPNPIFGGANVDGYHILNEVNSQYELLINKLTEKEIYSKISDGFFIRDDGHVFHIGRESSIKNVLGAESPFAHENTLFVGEQKIGRPIDFLHSYFLKKNGASKIPDLAELLELQPKHLQNVLARANAGEESIRLDGAAFERPRLAGSDWDRMASEFEKGLHVGKLAVFSKEGVLSKIITIDRTSAPPPIPQTQTEESVRSVPPPSGRGSGYSGAHDNSELDVIKKKPSRMTITMMIVAGIVVFGAGVATWLWQQKVRQNERQNQVGPE